MSDPEVEFIAQIVSGIHTRLDTVLGSDYL